MRRVGTFEGKTHFSALVDAAELGETIVITRNGKPVAQLGPLLDERSERAREALDRANAVLERGAIVPSHWRLDVRNALLSAERRRRLKAAEVDAMLRDLGALPIEIVAEWSGNEGELACARAHRLSLYDAAYLDLAVRRNVPLMTRDESLGAAADTLALRWAPGRRRR